MSSDDETDGQSSSSRRGDEHAFSEARLDLYSLVDTLLKLCIASHNSSSAGVGSPGASPSRLSPLDALTSSMGGQDGPAGGYHASSEWEPLSEELDGSPED